MPRDELSIWLNHFEYHAEHPRCVPPGLPDALSEHERRLIGGSIATLQLGECSEGVRLLRAARRFADAHPLASLVRITELFIREQQRHAQLLGEFLRDHRLRARRSDWTVTAFRCLRRLGGLELYLHVLICAELIGTVYYRALAAATGCQRLKVLCRTLVADELAHVGFGSQLLLGLRARRAPVMRTVARLAHWMLFIGAAGVVWLTHRAVLRHGGHDARSFLRACRAQYAFYLEPVAAAVAAAQAVPR
jgi:hypothetical protein